MGEELFSSPPPSIVLDSLPMLPAGNCHAAQRALMDARQQLHVVARGARPPARLEASNVKRPRTSEAVRLRPGGLCTGLLPLLMGCATETSAVPETDRGAQPGIS